MFSVLRGGGAARSFAAGDKAPAGDSGRWRQDGEEMQLHRPRRWGQEDLAYSKEIAFISWMYICRGSTEYATQLKND